MCLKNEQNVLISHNNCPKKYFSVFLVVRGYVPILGLLTICVGARGSQDPPGSYALWFGNLLGFSGLCSVHTVSGKNVVSGDICVML